MNACRWSSETSDERSSRSVADGERDLRWAKKASTVEGKVDSESVNGPEA